MVIDFANFDSITAYNKKKPFKILRKTTYGSINSSLSETMDQKGLPWELINQLSDIYAWTIDFTRLQRGDRFKIIYNERYIEDTILVGIKNIDAAYFEHNQEELYAFYFITDSLKKTPEFYDEKGNSLQRTFLKSPLRFSNISSRYNLKRRIAYYGNRVKPHKGTDFAAPVGTPIMATADGRVVKSSYTRGNGYYVKIQHNNKYSTQYLHMQKNGRIKKGRGGKTPPIGPYGDFFQCLRSNDPRTGRNRLISYTMIVLGYLNPILVILKIFDSYHAVTSS